MSAQTKTVREALADAMDEEMERDSKVFLLGMCSLDNYTSHVDTIFNMCR